MCPLNIHDFTFGGSVKLGSSDIKSFLSDYFGQLAAAFQSVDPEKIESACALVRLTINNSGKIIILGNGGSAAIASHAAVDFVKAAGVRALSFSDASMLTCFSNDYGYENCAAKIIEFYANPSDLVVLISSSGESDNIIAAAEQSEEMGLALLTFSGFSKSNRLAKYGDVRFWCDSNLYNTIENTHQIWLLAIIDYVIANKE